MPKKTFFHLPEEKQLRLLDAASIEFSRTSLKEASIANIVKLAEIPRGSFYQYFEDKEDLYYYYFDLLRQDSKKNIEQAIKEAEGDLFEGIDNYFSKMIFEVLIGQHSRFYQNLFMNLDYYAMNRVSPHVTPNDRKSETCQGKRDEYSIYRQIDLTKLTVYDEQEFKMLMQMLMNIVFSSITEGYRKLEENSEYDIEEIIRHFKTKLNWLKKGACK